MMRLIDADALIEAHYQHCNTHHDDAFPSWSLELMLNAPTIDAVPVVRCKDCKFHGVEESMGEQKPKLYLHYCEDTNRIVEPTCFCSFAERKDDETN